MYCTSAKMCPKLLENSQVFPSEFPFSFDLWKCVQNDAKTLFSKVGKKKAKFTKLILRTIQSYRTCTSDQGKGQLKGS